ncbi:MAG: phytoene/squalene synthase family protein [Cyclobacteriaceae bacterium]|nr:phytoene/squalene synthase family protein [Cyclobacteriaceae bacterium]
MGDQGQFDRIAIRTSRLTTRTYSTSFTLGIRCLDREFRDPIYSIYGFVRFADEIVDTFEDCDKAGLLKKFADDTWHAIDNGISLNPILHSFQKTVAAYAIDRPLIEQFMASMEMDLSEKNYDQSGFEKYVLGSAEVVGLMCLKVFTRGNGGEFTRLKPQAMKLGSAFQKINFLRDLHADYRLLGRSYFPGVQIERFDEQSKQQIESGILADFQEGFKGIKQLPRGARLGVYVAYLYYMTLFRKIRRLPSTEVLKSRVRVRNRQKLIILGYSFLKHQFNLI